MNGNAFMNKQNSDLNVCFIGGDNRQKYAAEELSLHFNVNTVGEAFEAICRSNVKRFDNPQKAILSSDVIVLPLPAALSESVISADKMIEHISKCNQNIKVFGGKLSPYLRGMLDASNIHYMDYYDDESLAIRNAYLSAEGALYYVMNEYHEALRFSSCAVVGFGRIGKALSEMLYSLNARVTVFARRDDSLALAEEKGFFTQLIEANLKTNSLSKLGEHKIIFNTVPYRIISNDLLLKLPSGTIVVELASQPGGFDVDIARQCEITVIEARGLPGKYAPVTAGKILADTLYRKINMGVEI